MRAKQIITGLIGVALISLFIIPPLLAPQYDVKQGTFQAHILTSAAGMGMAGRPITRAQVEDEIGRRFWIGVPSVVTVAPGTQILINVLCESEAYESCIGRYRRSTSRSD